MRNIGEYALRFVLSPRSLSVRYRNTRTTSLPLFGRISAIYSVRAAATAPCRRASILPSGLPTKAMSTRPWHEAGSSPTTIGLRRRYSRAPTRLNIEAAFEIAKGLKVQLTFNRTDNRNSQVQFMYAGMPTSLSGSYTKTHCAILTSLRSSKADDGYYSQAFADFIANIPEVRARVEAQYAGAVYPSGGFMADNAHAGFPFDPAVGTVSETSSDVLIPPSWLPIPSARQRKESLNPFRRSLRFFPTGALPTTDSSTSAICVAGSNRSRSAMPTSAHILWNRSPRSSTGGA